MMVFPCCMSFLSSLKMSVLVLASTPARGSSSRYMSACCASALAKMVFCCWPTDSSPICFFAKGSMLVCCRLCCMISLSCLVGFWGCLMWLYRPIMTTSCTSMGNCQSMS